MHAGLGIKLKKNNEKYSYKRFSNWQICMFARTGTRRKFNVKYLLIHTIYGIHTNKKNMLVRWVMKILNET